MNREALAWAGGFYSGEGYTGLNKFTTTGKKGKRRSYWKRYPSMNICQSVSPETLNRFNYAIGELGKVYGPYGPYGVSKKRHYVLSITGFEKVQAAISMLWYFLSIEKQRQASAVLRKYLKQEKKV